MNYEQRLAYSTGQARLFIDQIEDEDSELYEAFKSTCHSAMTVYEKSVEQGIAPVYAVLAIVNALQGVLTQVAQGPPDEATS